jgi:hypothetical protein
MERTFKILLTVLPLLFAQQIMAQTNACADYHKFNCMRSTDKRLSINGQSKSAPVQVGKETELNIIVYRGQDYKITLCHDEKILGEKLAIRLVEKIRMPRDVNEPVTMVEAILDKDGKPTGATRQVQVKDHKRVYDEVERVLWDNTDHDMAQQIEFSCTATKRLAIEVNAMGGDGSKVKKGQQNFDIGCVGILIEHMPTPELGF